MKIFLINFFESLTGVDPICQAVVVRLLKNQGLVDGICLRRLSLGLGWGIEQACYAAISLLIRPGLRSFGPFVLGPRILLLAFSRYPDTAPVASASAGAARALISLTARLRLTVITLSNTCTVTLARPQ